MFTLPPLPYAETALAPHMSRETLATHHGKHHAAYVDKTNKLLKDTDIKASSLEDVVREAHRRGAEKLYQNAAQAWSHAFFWNCMSPDRAPSAGAELQVAIDAAFGSFDKFHKQALEEGGGHFGSGWLWLVADRSGALTLKSMHDADTPIVEAGVTPIFTCDLWEHAYYLDHKNARPAYLETFFERLIDWRFADSQYGAARSGAAAWRYPPPEAKAA